MNMTEHLLGELVGYSYKKKGVAGVIIDGCITDVKALYCEWICVAFAKSQCPDDQKCRH